MAPCVILKVKPKAFSPYNATTGPALTCGAKINRANRTTNVPIVLFIDIFLSPSVSFNCKQAGRASVRGRRGSGISFGKNGRSLFLFANEVNVSNLSVKPQAVVISLILFYLTPSL